MKLIIAYINPFKLDEVVEVAEPVGIAAVLEWEDVSRLVPVPSGQFDGRVGPDRPFEVDVEFDLGQGEKFVGHGPP